MTEEDLRSLYLRLRKIHHAERRRAWWRGRAEPLALGAVFFVAAWALWKDHAIESACLGAFGLVLAAAALT